MNDLAVKMEIVAASKNKRLYVTERILAMMTEPQRNTLVMMADELGLDCVYEEDKRRFIFCRMERPETPAYSPECDCEDCEFKRSKMGIVN